MGLMSGTGPLSRNPAGKFNFESPSPGWALYLEPTPKRIRVLFGNETIADSRRVMMLHESGLQPIYYFPPEDVRQDLLEPSDRHTRCPKKGEASYYTIRVDDRVLENGAWYYPDPLPGTPPIKDLIAFYWDRMDRWLEEAEEVVVHPRDPYHRLDVVKTDRRVRVLLDGRVLADSRNAVALFESNLPARWYLPTDDVQVQLEPSDTVTRCPYKGSAGYYSAAGIEDLVWYYADPLPEAGRIKGLRCFFNEKVDIELDGEVQARPVTPWSARIRSDERQAA